MAKVIIYTLEQINQISSTKKAVKDDIYQDVDGNLFKGTSIGSLTLIQKSSGVPHEPSNDSNLTSTNVGSAINELGVKTKIIEDTMATDVELQSAKNDLKGFATAMAILL